VEYDFCVLESDVLRRPVWHHSSGQTQAHVMAYMLGYVLWKTLDQLTKQAGLETEIRKPDLRRPRFSATARPMTPEVILRESGHIAIGDIMLQTTDGRELALRQVARPLAQPARILKSLGLKILE
jgi:hypothetical protein